MPYSFAYVSDDRRRVSQFARAQRFSAAAILPSTPVQEFFRDHKIKDNEIQIAMIEYEYSGARPNRIRLPQYDHAAIRKALIGAEVELSEREIDSTLEKEESLRGRREYGAVIALLRQLQQLYPWSSLVFHDLAIAQDESGYPRKALEYVLPAVILNPMEPSEWKSLGIILQKLNNRVEWQYVYGFRHYFEKRRAGGM